MDRHVGRGRPWVAILVLLSLVMAGCGTGPNAVSPSTNTGPADASAATAGPSSSVVVARVSIGGGVAGATIRLQDLDGSVVASGVTNGNGVVFLQIPQARSEFRAVATLPGFSEDFRAEMRGFDPTRQQVVISPLTDLVSRYLAANPGVSVGEAERRVKRAVRVPDVVSVSIGLEEPNPVFSDLALMRMAGQNGGWIALRNALVATARTGGGQPYLLSKAVIDRPMTGLEAGLLQAADISRKRVQSRLRVPDATPQTMAVTDNSPYTMAGGPTGWTESILLGIGTGIVSDVIVWGMQSAWGWASNQLGLNYGTSAQLSQIENMLYGIQTMIAQMEQQFFGETLLNLYKSTNTIFAPVVTGNSQMMTSLTGADITNQPCAPPPTFATLVSDINLTNPTYPEILYDAQTNLNGQTGLIKQCQTYILNDMYGLDDPSGTLNFPFRSTPLISGVSPVFNHFAGLQIQTLNLYSEQAHNYQISPDPVQGVSLMTPAFQTAVASLKAQRQLLPFQLPAGVVVDYENAITWYDTVMDMDTWFNANLFATSFQLQVILADGSVQVYDDWRLPMYGEGVALQERARYVPLAQHDDSVNVYTHNSYPDCGQATSGLPALGFQNVATAINGPNGGKSGQTSGDLWMTYDLFMGDGNGNQLQSQGYWCFRLDRDSTSDNTINKGTSAKYPYVMCRGFGPNTLVAVQVPASPYTNYPPSLGQFGASFTAAECATYGVPTSITNMSTTTAPATVSYPDPQTGQPDTLDIPAGSLQMQASLSYTINVGGTFTLGYPTQKTTKYASHSTSATVSTADLGNGNPNLVRQLISWTGNNTAALRVLNLPYVGGIATPLQIPTTPVTVTASLLGAGGNTLTQQLQVTPTAISPHTLTSICISPRNQIYGASNGQAPNGSYPYYCTAFYADGTMASQAANVTWTIPANQANAQMVPTTGTGVSLLMNQPAQPTSVPYDLTITAAYQGKTDTTTIRIVPPVQ